LCREIRRRRTDVVGIFPGRGARIRLVGAVLAEQHDEWTEMHRYIGLDILGKSRQAPIQYSPAGEVPLTAITRLKSQLRITRRRFDTPLRRT
jgi:hypothetical protein